MDKANKKRIVKARIILALMLLCAANIMRVPKRVLELKEYPKIAQEATKISIIPEDTDFTYAVSEPLPEFVPLSHNYISQLTDFNYLTRSIFLTDPRTKLLESDIDILEFLEKDFTIDTNTDEPQILIFHTHSMEMFADSDPSDPMTGVLGVGKYLAEILEREHGIKSIHHTERFDVVDGIPQRQGSYARMEPAIRQILEDNPSIQVVIDLHRDGVGAHVAPMVTYIDGKRTAQIMLVNGLSRRYRNGEITPVTWLPNPYQKENLAFSFNLQLSANQMYPGFARRVYLLEYRYSLHMAPRSILLEVGAQNNTLLEALNSVYPAANVIASVIK
jgi:stage II sporulation protein P